jgi:hypothetical protein
MIVRQRGIQPITCVNFEVYALRLLFASNSLEELHEGIFERLL